MLAIRTKFVVDTEVEARERGTPELLVLAHGGWRKVQAILTTVPVNQVRANVPLSSFNHPCASPLATQAAPAADEVGFDHHRPLWRKYRVP
jgi:hypothetical protein